MLTPEADLYQFQEVASALARDIDNGFERCIKTLQSLKLEQTHAEVLVVQRHRFQSWAYGIALADILGRRQPLHERLAGPLYHQVCVLLKEILQSLEVWSHRTIENERTTINARSTIVALQKVRKGLAALFSEGNLDFVRRASIHKFAGLGEDDSSLIWCEWDHLAH